MHGYAKRNEIPHTPIAETQATSTQKRPNDKDGKGERRPPIMDTKCIAGINDNKIGWAAKGEVCLTSCLTSIDSGDGGLVWVSESCHNTLRHDDGNEKKQNAARYHTSTLSNSNTHKKYSITYPDNLPQAAAAKRTDQR